MGLAALASGDSELVKGMERTLLTLGEHQGRTARCQAMLRLMERE